MSYRDDQAARRALAEALGREVVATLPGLAELRIASPCQEPWGQMPGGDRVRHCRRCDKDVYDLSALTRDEVADLLYQRGADLCARFYRRADGTIMTADCVDVRRLRTRRRLVTAAASTAIAAAVAIAGGAGSEPSDDAPEVAETRYIPPPPEEPEDEPIDHIRPQRYELAGSLSVSWEPTYVKPAPVRVAVDPALAPDDHLPRVSETFSGDPSRRR